ncbi:MAG: hypothetical protein JWP30_171 [Homoserinimonas sp.]|jgi:TetR/AcrR family transcriptional regulator of autoinduction and epiphytic fitness|nr:hypothetical protein [Homoserinimonas sp.]
MALGSVPPAADRQQRVKNDHRRAIAEAAVTLAQQFGPGNFSADQLAEQANVARRTIFNHFRSIDDATYAGLSQILETATASVARILASNGRRLPRADDLSSAFDDLSGALLGADLVQPLSQIVRTIASREPDHPRTSQWVGTVLASIIPLLETAAQSRAPRSHVRSRALLVRTLLAALSVAFDEWHEETHAVDDPPSRVVWRAALEASLSLLGSGFAASPAGNPAA